MRLARAPMRGPRRVGGSAVLVLCLTASAAQGAPPEPSTEEISAWPEDVPRFRWWEYAGTAALLGGSIALRLTVDVSGEPSWRGGILLDDATYDAFFIDSPHRFRLYRTVGDVGYLAAFAWSAVDPLLAGIAYDWDTALQMTLMNLEAFSVYSTILSVSQLVVRRERPSTQECADRRQARALGVSCGTSQNINRSFIGGHTGTVATAATLTCLHHGHLPLWGSPQADALPCVTWTAMTALVFTSRTLTGQHNFTDNMLGVVVGTFSGLVPWWLHYAYPMWTTDPAPATALSVAAAPVPGGVTALAAGLLP